MSVEALLAELRRLSRADKIRAVQVLITELAAEEQVSLLPKRHYEVWSPYDAPEAAQALTELLEQDRTAAGRNDSA